MSQQKVARTIPIMIMAGTTCIIHTPTHTPYLCALRHRTHCSLPLEESVPKIIRPQFSLGENRPGCAHIPQMLSY